MKQIKNIWLPAISLMLITSACNKKIKELQIDPNNPVSVPSSLILGTVLTDMSGTGNQGALGGINSWDNVHRWNQYHCSNYDYYNNNIYSWNNGSFDPYLVLKNVNQMEQEVLKTGGSALNPYEAVGHFVRAYYFYNLTSLFGDVPLDSALLGANDFNPGYTPQEKVFAYVLNQLDSANNDFAALQGKNDNSLSSAQDIYYHGNLSAWQKLVNSYRLRVLLSLSKQTTDATLNVASQFQAVISNSAKYPVFTSQGDDFKFTYVNATYSSYYFNPSNYGSIAARYNMAKTYIDACTGIKDPRVFITSEPAWALVGSDTANPAQYKYFAGASTGESLATMYNNANAGLYSFINRFRYFETYVGEPDVLVGYKEMCFNIAEAIERGWITSENAETWYKTGINESMKFYNIDTAQTQFTAHFLPPTNSSVTETVAYPFTFVFNTYYQQDSVKLSAISATAIRQIILQKYIASFENSGWESYYNWRRTGVPAFEGGTGVGNNGVVPLRWQYPVTEQTQNAKAWTAALSQQGFSADDLNQVMWLLK